MQRAVASRASAASVPRSVGNLVRQTTCPCQVLGHVCLLEPRHSAGNGHARYTHQGSDMRPRNVYGPAACT